MQQASTHAGELIGLIERAQVKRRLPTPPMRRSLRREAGLTESDIAGVVGVSRQAVSNWERGRRTPRGAQLQAYVDVLDELRKVVTAA